MTVEAATVLLHLALQGMIAAAAAEVSIRYTKWFLTIPAIEGLLLRSLILGIAVTHVALFAEICSWMFEQAAHPALFDALLENKSFSFQRSVLFRLALFIGISIHMMPIWRIVHRYKWREIAVAMFVRAVIGTGTYLLILHFSGALRCYFTVGQGFCQI